MNKIIVIGGGPAGMFAAIAAAETGSQVILLEKNEKLGKKLFITGKGRCNITNAGDMDNLFANVMTNAKFLYSAFYSYDNQRVIDFFERNGLRTKIERGNRVFPVSDHSSDVIATLQKVLKEKKVKVMLHTQVQSLLMESSGEDAPENIVTGVKLTDGTTMPADAVIIATGGFSYQTTGSTGDGYRFAKEAGHTVTDIRPSLVPFLAKEDYVRQMQGLSLKNVEVRILNEKKLLYQELEARERQAFNQAELERMKWFLEDMKELSPVKGEWARINEEHTRLSRYNDIIDSCQKAREALTEADYSALELVDSAISAIGDVSDVDAKLEKIYTQLNDAREIIDSASDDVEHYLDRTDFDEGRFEELDQRINLYLELARKYHVEPEELYAEMQKVSEKAAEMEGLSDLTALFNKAHKAKTQYDKLAGELSKERKKGALNMQKSITDVMQTLAMAGGSFEVAVTPAEAPSSVGIDHCEFLVAGHAGVPRRSLSKVASGGELARISLAIAVTDTMTATVDTLIFDEVDSGIGVAQGGRIGR